MNERIRVGDRVRVNRQTGEVVGVVEQPNRYNLDPRGRYHVLLDNGVGTIYTRDAVKIEEPTPEPTAKVGDRVIVREGYYNSPSVIDGREGVVTRIDTHLTPVKYHVDLGGEYGVPDLRVARRVEVLPSPEPEKPAEVLIDAKRLQAAQAAHAILGSDALLDDLIGVAEFVLGEHRRADTGDAATAGPAPDADREATKAIYGLGRSSMDVDYDGTGGDVVEVEGCYLQPADVERLISFLQAAQRRFARENPERPTPF